MTENHGYRGPRDWWRLEVKELSNCFADSIQPNTDFKEGISVISIKLKLV